MGSALVWLEAYTERASTFELDDVALAQMTAALLLAEAEADPVVQSTRLQLAGALAGILTAIHKRRQKMHDQADSKARELAALLASTISTQTLASVLSKDLTRRQNRAAALAQLESEVLKNEGLGPQWRSALTELHTLAKAEGTGAASWMVADDTSSLAFHVEQAAGALDVWSGAQDLIDTQLGGLAGDVVRVFLDDPDAELLATLAQGDGAAYYLDVALSGAYGDAALDAYGDAGIGLLDWVSMGDGNVDGTCQTLEAQSPYPVDAFPFIPAHGGCRCWPAPSGTVS